MTKFQKIFILQLFFVALTFAEFDEEWFTPKIDASYKIPNDCVKKGSLVKCRITEDNFGGGEIFNLYKNYAVSYYNFEFFSNLSNFAISAFLAKEKIKQPDELKMPSSLLTITNCDSIEAVFYSSVIDDFNEIFSYDWSEEENQNYLNEVYKDAKEKGLYNFNCVGLPTMRVVCYSDGNNTYTKYDEVGIEIETGRLKGSKDYCNKKFHSYWK